MGHGHGDGAVARGVHRVELVADGRRGRGADLEGHQLGATVHARVHEAADHEEPALIGLHRVAAEVDHVVRALEVLRLPFELASVHAHQRHAAVRAADGAPVEAVGRPEGVGPAAGEALGLVAAVVEDELLGPALVAQGLELAADLRHGLLPGGPAPLALAALADPLERVDDALGVVGGLDHALGLAANGALGVRVLRVALDLPHAPVLHPADDPAVGRAAEADGGHGLRAAVVDAGGHGVAHGGEGLPVTARAAAREEPAGEGGGAQATSEGQELASIEAYHCS